MVDGAGANGLIAVFKSEGVLGWLRWLGWLRVSGGPLGVEGDSLAAGSDVADCGFVAV